MNMENYRDAFLEEARENINNLNSSLITFERDIRDLTPVNELFRFAHTLKGMSATMGYDKMASFTHLMEELLDSVRSGQIKADNNVMNALFRSVDVLEEFTESIAVSGTDESAAAKSAADNIKAMITGEAYTKQAVFITKDSTALPADSEVDEGVIKAAQANGMNILKITVHLSKQCAFKAVRAFMVMRNLSEKGEAVKTIPSAKEIEDGKIDDSFTIYMVTGLTAQEAHAIIMKVSEVENCEAVEIAAPAAVKEASAEANVVQAAVNFYEAPAKNEAKKNVLSQSVRVNIEKLDSMMNLVGELVINKIRLDQIAREKKYEMLNETVNEFDRVIDELQIQVTGVRMLPVSQIFDRFPRSTRDLAQQAGKQVDVEITGGDIEIDRTVLEEINEPMLHLIRNSVAHGIETPEERVKKGKNPKGTIRLIARRERNSVFIEVYDDGRGIDITRVKAKAVEKGLITPERAAAMSEDEAVNIIALPGFSTMEAVNQVAGRGVGVDVVKTKVESFGGIFKLENFPGEGLKAVLKLPVTLAIIQALLVKCGKDTYAIPVIHTTETIEIEKKDIKRIQEKRVIVLREEVIPVYALTELLGKPAPDNEFPSLVIADVRDKKVALEVDRVIGQQEIAIKSMGDFLKSAKGFSGVTILGDGRISLIVDIPTLL